MAIFIFLLCYLLVIRDSIEQLVHLLCWKSFIGTLHNIPAIGFISRINDAHQRFFAVAFNHLKAEISFRLRFFIIHLDFRVINADSCSHLLHRIQNIIPNQYNLIVVNHDSFLLLRKIV